MRKPVYTIRAFTLRPDRQYFLADHELTEIVDGGYEYVVVLGPSYRLTSTADDWLDYGMPDMVDDVPGVYLRTSRMEKS